MSNVYEECRKKRRPSSPRRTQESPTVMEYILVDVVSFPESNLRSTGDSSLEINSKIAFGGAYLRFRKLKKK